MLELPESHILAQQMEQALAGKRILSVEAGHSPHRFAFFQGLPETYPLLLEGLTVNGAHAAGGWVELRLGKVRLAFNDGVNMRLFAAGRKLPAKHQMRLLFDDQSSLVCSVQMYGALLAFREGELDNPYYYGSFEKPSPYEAAFDRAYFESLRTGLKPSLSVKAFLATEQRIPGLGNGVLQDILFHARLHPKTKLPALIGADWDRLFESVKTTLHAMRDAGGRDTEKDLHGQPGGYQTILSRNTLAYPCPVCGGPLRRQAFLGGNIYFCLHCQPMEQ